MQARIVQLFAAAILATFSGAAFAQMGQTAPLPMPSAKTTGASLEETLAWLKGKINVYEQHGPNGGPTRRYVWFDDCKMTLLTVEGYSQLRIDEADLDRLNPDSETLHSLGDNEVFHTTFEYSYGLYSPGPGEMATRSARPLKDKLLAGDEELAKQTLPLIQANANTIVSSNSLYIPFILRRDNELTPRIVKAMQHAAQLCYVKQAQAKKKPTKPSNEPF
jgi:hypothetical protein